jgi:hypothetical protein
MAKQIATKKEVINGQTVLVKVFAASNKRVSPQQRTVERKPRVETEEQEVDLSMIPADLRKKLGFED